MENKILELLQDMSLKMNRIENKVDNIENKVDNLENKVNNLENKVDRIEVQQNENTQILRALESAKDIHFAKLDKLENDVAYLTGEVKSIRKDLNAVEGITAKNWNDIIEIKKNISLN